MEGIVDGAPQLRVAMFAPDDVRIEDTWDVLGMRGTGSHHFSVTDVVVPADRTTNPFGDEPCVDVPIVHLPAPPLYSTCLSSVAVGVAQGAVDDILALAAGKVPLFEERALATNAGFQRDVASAEAALRAARAVLYETAESLWATATTGTPLTLEERARIRATAVWTTQQATAVVDAAFRLGGGSSIYANNPLQRRFRDIHTLTHHFLVKEDTLTTAGAILAGQDPAVMVF
jgi:alkylation response protein AidB-like acyl-CoA dehydrogenase